MLGGVLYPFRRAGLPNIDLRQMEPISNAAIVYHPDFRLYDFGPEHPWRPERIDAGLALLQVAGLWDSERECLPPVTAGPEDLMRVHDGGFLDAVKAAGRGSLPDPEG
ncbi:MAG: hypothetical protein ACRDFX_01895, partial [Chloroflexota bacterium]